MRFLKCESIAKGLKPGSYLVNKTGGEIFLVFSPSLLVQLWPEEETEMDYLLGGVTEWLQMNFKCPFFSTLSLGSQVVTNCRNEERVCPLGGSEEFCRVRDARKRFVPLMLCPVWKEAVP